MVRMTPVMTIHVLDFWGSSPLGIGSGLMTDGPSPLVFSPQKVMNHDTKCPLAVGLTFLS
jgi:hypothetical protein